MKDRRWHVPEDDCYFACTSDGADIAEGGVAQDAGYFVAAHNADIAELEAEIARRDAEMVPPKEYGLVHLDTYNGETHYGLWKTSFTFDTWHTTSRGLAIAEAAVRELLVAAEFGHDGEPLDIETGEPLRETEANDEH